MYSPTLEATKVKLHNANADLCLLQERYKALAVAAVYDDTGEFEKQVFHVEQAMNAAEQRCRWLRCAENQLRAGENK